MKNHKLPDNYEIIPTYPMCCINTHGDIYAYTSGNHIPWDSEENGLENACVLLDDEWIPVRNLLVETYVGHMDSPIFWRDKPKSASDFSYRFESIDRSNPDCWIIDGYMFKPIPNFENYMISECGVIISKRDLACIHIKYAPNHYPCASLRHPDSVLISKILINRLVYSAFIGPIDENMSIGYKDNRPYNNHYTNLRQITHYAAIGSNANEHKIGDDDHFSDETVHEICRRMSEGQLAIDIADEMCIDYNATFCALIAGLYSGTSHKDIVSEYDFSNYHPRTVAARYPSRVLNAVKQMIAEGYNTTRILERFPDMNTQMIHRIAEEYGLELNRKRLTYQEIDKITQELEFYSAREIMEKYKLTSEQVSMIRKGKFFEIRPRDYRVPPEERIVIPIPPEVKAAIIEDLKNGVPTTVVARKYDRSSAAISKIKKQLGLIVPQKTLTPEQRHEIYEQYQSGISAKELAEKYNVSKQTIWTTVKEINSVSPR